MSDEKFSEVGKPISVAELFRLLQSDTVEEAYAKAHDQRIGRRIEWTVHNLTCIGTVKSIFVEEIDKMEMLMVDMDNGVVPVSVIPPGMPRSTAKWID